MSLRRQILLGLTLFFTLLMGLLFLERVQSTRQYIETQLSSTAQDAASSLVFPVSRALGKDDVILAETAIKSILDRGYFKQIEIVSLRGASLAKIVHSKPIQGVPGWFIRLIPIEATPGNALISDGWRQLGRIVVISEPELAYQQLWSMLLRTTGILLLTYIICIIGLNQLIGYFLRPLDDIERSAQQIQQRQFNPIQTLPFTRELKRVVLAFNVMIERVRQFLAIEQQRAEEFRVQAFSDETTGLDNRRSLDLHLGTLLSEMLPGTQGAAISIQLDDLMELNNREGYKKGDELLKSFSQKLVENLHGTSQITARLNGSTLFALLLDSQQIETIAKSLLQDLNQLNSSLNTPIKFAVAIVDFQQGVSKASLLGASDLALQQALFNGGTHLQRASASDNNKQLPSGSQQWREVLQHAIHAQAWNMQAQAVQSLQQSKLLHHELMARLAHSDGVWINAGLFMPMAARHGLLIEAEQSLFDLAIAKLASSAALQGHAIALNIGLQGALGSVEGQDAFIARLDKLSQLASLISFEVPENQLLLYPALAKRLAGLLRERSFGFGIDQFGFSPAAGALLRELHPSYVKIDRRLIQDIAEHIDTRKMLESLLQVAQSLDICTIAQGIENTAQLPLLKTMGISGIQGYHIGRPFDLG